MTLLDNKVEIEKNDLIWQLVSIEENVQKLFLTIENDYLNDNKEIQELLKEISDLAVKSRKKIIHLMMNEMLTTKDEAILTQKEIRELLEDFA